MALPLAEGPAELERRRLLTMGSLRLGQLAQERLRGDPRQVQGVADCLLGIALQASTRSLITRDSHWRRPNAAALAFFRGPYAGLLWPEHGDCEPGFYGVAGSLAFTLYRRREPGVGLAPPQLLTAMLRGFWEDQHTSYDHTPRQRVQALLERYDLQQNWAGMVRFLDAVYTEVPATCGGCLRAALYELHRRGLGPDCWSWLKRRVLLQEIPPGLVPVWGLLQEELNRNEALRRHYQLPARAVSWLEQCVQRLQGLAIPAGFPLVLWALVVEGLLKAAVLLVDYQQLSWLEYLADVDAEPHRYAVAEHLALAYDALEALGWFESLESNERLGLQEAVLGLVQQLLASLGDAELPATGDYRLAELS